jgi:hypothetical protein
MREGEKREPPSPEGGSPVPPEADSRREKHLPARKPARDLERQVPGERRVPREELDRIIRRAAELQFHASDGPTEELPESEVVRIGREVGLDTQHVRRAMEEARADALAPDLPPDTSLLRRAIGPGRIQLRRVVPGPPAEVETQLVTRLRDRESLHPVRHRGGVSIWEPAEGFLPQLQRGLKWKGHRYDLARARQIEVTVLALEEGFSLVTLTLDLRNLRAEHGGGYLGGFAALGGGAGVAVGIAGLSFPLLGVVALAGAGAGLGAAGGVPAGRKAFRDQAERVRLSAEGLLDRLERGDLQPRPRVRGP